MATKKLRILSLDGGGVRGLSTLIILERLLYMINEELRGGHGPLLVSEVFDFVVGTSTGGLIALMMVKLNMTVQECIKQYKGLSMQIFGKPHWLGKRTMGFGTTKYSGARLRKFVVNAMKQSKNALGPNHTMEDDTHHKEIHCSVVCRELQNNWTKTRMEDAVFLCSHECRKEISRTEEYITCKMCDAARATSAAPTYFPPVRILKKILVDGGFGETNNPSNAAWDHYDTKNFISKTDQALWVNIGTGTLPPESSRTAPPRPFWAMFVPESLLNIVHLTRDLQKIATDSEKVGREMQRLAKEARDDRLRFWRFSANNGLHEIELDAYEQLEKIETLTHRYLEIPEVVARLRTTAEALAASCRDRRKESQAATEREHPFLNPLPHAIIMGESTYEELLVTPTTDEMPALAGRSEPTVEGSDTNVTPRTTTIELNQPGPVVEPEVDRREMGAQFLASSTGSPSSKPQQRSALPTGLEHEGDMLGLDGVR